MKLNTNSTIYCEELTRIDLGQGDSSKPLETIYVIHTTIFMSRKLPLVSLFLRKIL